MLKQALYWYCILAFTFLAGFLAAVGLALCTTLYCAIGFSCIFAANCSLFTADYICTRSYYENKKLHQLF